MEQAVAQRYRGSWRVRWSSSPVVVLLGWALFTAPWDQALAGQLPPEIQVDRYILQAERAIQEQDYLGAKTAMDKILELQEQHDWELEEKFFFRYADVAERLGFHEMAVKFLTQYLTVAGQDGEFYREALELLDEAEAAAEEARRIARRIAAEAAAEEARRIAEAERRRAEAAAEEARRIAEERRRAEAAAGAGAVPICAGQAEGAACWMELEGQPTFCFVWNSALSAGATVTWSAECSGGLAQGTGTHTWVSGSGQQTSESTGLLQDGKRQGQWVIRYADGIVSEGPYVDGERQGQWVIRYAAGRVDEGPYVEGKKHGRWVFRDADGRVAEGPFVDGKEHGHWVGSYRNRERWYVTEGPYVEGWQHGDWVIYRRDDENKRIRGGGAYVEGKKHGDWVEYNEDDKKREYTYNNGKRVNN